MYIYLCVCVCVQHALRQNKLLDEEIRELEDWIVDRNRQTSFDDGSIFHIEQIRERLEQYQVGSMFLLYIR
jgi:hypothetical protein